MVGHETSRWDRINGIEYINIPSSKVSDIPEKTLLYNSKRYYKNQVIAWMIPAAIILFAILKDPADLLESLSSESPTFVIFFFLVILSVFGLPISYILNMRSRKPRLIISKTSVKSAHVSIMWKYIRNMYIKKVPEKGGASYRLTIESIWSEKQIIEVRGIEGEVHQLAELLGHYYAAFRHESSKEVGIE